MKKSTKAKYVEVRWTDARSSSTWKDVGEVRGWLDHWQSKTISSVGWLLSRDKNSVVLAQSMDFVGGSAEMTSGHLEIPARMVIGVYDLGRKRTGGRLA